MRRVRGRCRRGHEQDGGDDRDVLYGNAATGTRYGGAGNDYLDGGDAVDACRLGETLVACEG